MKRSTLAAVYIAAMALANPVLADMQAAQAALSGSMAKLVFHDTPKPTGTADFETFEGAPLNLSDWQGKWTVVNFWATWCAPCRHEMPMLDALQAEFGGDTFEVVTIATTRNPPQAMVDFFEEVGIENLPLHRDPGSTLAREMAVLGLPITVILNPEGDEIARMRGDADWSSDSARAMIRALTGLPGTAERPGGQGGTMRPARPGHRWCRHESAPAPSGGERRREQGNMTAKP